MNIKIKSTGTVHEVDDANRYADKSHIYAYWSRCGMGINAHDALETTDPLTCKTCLRLAKKRG